MRYDDYYALCVNLNNKGKEKSIVIKDMGYTIQALKLAKKIYENKNASLDEILKGKEWYIEEKPEEHSCYIDLNLETGKYSNGVYLNMWNDDESKNKVKLDVSFPFTGSMDKINEDIAFLEKHENDLMTDGDFYPYALCKKRER